MNCPNCNLFNPPGALLCDCGYSFELETTPITPTTEAAFSGNHKNGRTLVERAFDPDWSMSWTRRVLGIALHLTAGTFVLLPSCTGITRFATDPAFQDPQRAEAYLNGLYAQGGVLYPFSLFVAPLGLIAAYGILRRRTWALALSRLVSFWLCLSPSLSGLVPGGVLAVGVLQLLVLRTHSKKTGSVAKSGFGQIWRQSRRHKPLYFSGFQNSRGSDLGPFSNFATEPDANTAGIHTWFGLAFVALMALHLTNNGNSLISYLRQRRGRRYLVFSVSLSLVLTAGVFLGVPPFSSFLAFGRDLRRSVALEDGSYQVLTTRLGQQGRAINIELRTGKHYQSPPQPIFMGLTFTTVPQVAFWIEDLSGRYVDTLYVTKKSTNASFVPSEDPFGSTARPEALPYWSHKRGVKYSNGLMVPDAGNADLDAVSGATPIANYDVRSLLTNDHRKFRVLMEINRSFDFNGFYSRDRYPGDPVYGGSGSSGQPSVIYAAEVDLDDGQTAYLLQPIGHGHYSGRDGRLYPDMQGIDTALQLVNRVVVDVPEEP